MKEYPKIDSIFKRDERGKFLIGEYSRPEFEYLKDNLWTWTEKIDGTNIRIMWDGKDIRYGGKTDNAQIPTKLLAWMQNHLLDNGDYAFNPAVFHEMFGGEGNVCLYGEGYGAGIQKGGGLYSPEQKFIVFDVKIGPWWLEPNSVADIANKLNIPMVPSMGTGTLEQIISEVRDIANNPPPSRYGTALIEGYVGKPLVSLFNRKNERIITKIKFKDFM